MDDEHAVKHLKVVQEKNTTTQRKIRQRQKEKVTNLNKQLEDLEGQLQAMQAECKKLDIENEVLLRQAEGKEAELQRETALLTEYKQRQQQQQEREKQQRREQSSSASDDRGQSGAGASGAAKTQVRTVPLASSREAPVMVISSCAGHVFEITKACLEVLPRARLQTAYSQLLASTAATLQAFEAAERSLRDAMLRPDVAIETRVGALSDLESSMTAQQSALRVLVKDVLQLYCHAFRAHPKETCVMDTRAGGAAAAAPLPTLKLSSEQQALVCSSMMRYFSAVKECMEQRSTLHAKLSQNEVTLLEWESVAAWLATDSLVTSLQFTLAHEVEVYLDWCNYICSQVLTPAQASTYILAHPIRDLLQACSLAVRASRSPESMTAATMPPPQAPFHFQAPSASAATAATPSGAAFHM